MKLIVDTQSHVELEEFSSEACTYPLFPHNEIKLGTDSAETFFSRLFLLSSFPFGHLNLINSKR